MSLSTPGLRALCLCVALLASLALELGAAGTEAIASWYVNGKSNVLILSPSVQIKEVESFKLLSKVSSIKVEISCTGGTLEKVKFETGGLISSGGKVKLTGCSTKLNEIKQLSCEPHSGAEKGVILTNELKGKLTLHSSALILPLESKSGETLATIETSEECLAGEKLPLIGKLSLKDGSIGTEATTHLFTEGPLTELWLVSKTEEHKTTTDGGLVLELSGEGHKGLK
jgi:hypothetical protein